ncbi:MAG: hypothetical protein LPK49_09905 [Bacteroidota bacterium]|nr:hypothetical protein [Bacteroidota bacterium]MDX5431343.1 hypothetical protein [Bacteroidota bacterium]
MTYVDRLHVSNEHNFDSWQPFGAFRVDYIDPALIDEVIQRKESGLNKYSQKYGQK